MKAPDADKKLFDTLSDLYEEVVFWPQGAKDLKYFKDLSISCEFLEPDLEEFRTRLKSGEYDYIGTRLHAGVLALQNNVFTQIIAVDNRASEMSKDIGLPVLSRDLGEEDLAKLLCRDPLDLRIPRPVIEAWKNEVSRAVYLN
jgi:hypothetical protein